MGFGRAHTVAWHRPLLQPHPHLVPILQPQCQPGPRAPDWAGVFAGPPRNRSLSSSPPKAPTKSESLVKAFAPRTQRQRLQHIRMLDCSSPSPCAQLSSARSRRQIWSLYENRVLGPAQASRHPAACVVLVEVCVLRKSLLCVNVIVQPLLLVEGRYVSSRRRDPTASIVVAVAMPCAAHFYTSFFSPRVAIPG